MKPVFAIGTDRGGTEALFNNGSTTYLKF